MQVEVCFLARDLREAASKTVVVVDILRASTTLATMLERGAGEVILAETADQARVIRDRLGRPVWLCGEEGGLPPADFDYGNSPRDLAELDLAGRAVVFTSSNGAKALARVARAGRVLVGCYANAEAVVNLAVGDARANGRDLAIVCSGRADGTAFALDDAVCAGYLVERLVAGIPWAEVSWRSLTQPHLLADWCFLDDSALAARRLYLSFRGDSLAVLRETRDAHKLMRLGLGPDLTYSLRVDTLSAVPELLAIDGRLTIVPARETTIP